MPILTTYIAPLQIKHFFQPKSTDICHIKALLMNTHNIWLYVQIWKKKKILSGYCLTKLSKSADNKWLVSRESVWAYITIFDQDRHFPSFFSIHSSLSCLDKIGWFPIIFFFFFFYKGCYFHEFLFAFLHTYPPPPPPPPPQTHETKVYSKKMDFAPKRSKVLPFRVYHVSEGSLNSHDKSYLLWIYTHSPSAKKRHGSDCAMWAEPNCPLTPADTLSRSVCKRMIFLIFSQ